jgi:WhiB family redox-sensing transcriptional regulator
MVEPDEVARATKPSDRVKVADGWRCQAACRGMDPAIWYPSPDVDEKSWAIAICAKCPVRRQCLDHALQRREPLGIWGGKTAGQRRGIVARRALGG